MRSRLPVRSEPPFLPRTGSPGTPGQATGLVPGRGLTVAGQCRARTGLRWLVAAPAGRGNGQRYGPARPPSRRSAVQVTIVGSQRCRAAGAECACREAGRKRRLPGWISGGVVDGAGMAVLYSSGPWTAAEEAGVSPARSRHCHRGANLTLSHRHGGKAEAGCDPGARKLRPSVPSYRSVVTPRKVRADDAPIRLGPSSSSYLS